MSLEGFIDINLLTSRATCFDTTNHRTVSVDYDVVEDIEKIPITKKRHVKDTNV